MLIVGSLLVNLEATLLFLYFADWSGHLLTRNKCISLKPCEVDLPDDKHEIQQIFFGIASQKLFSSLTP